MNVQSEGADAEGGVAVGEGESGVDLGELAAAEEAVAVGELGVVLERSLLRPPLRRGRSSGGGGGPLPDGLGEAVVHREREHGGAMAAEAALPKKEEGENGDSAETEHFLGFPP